MARTLGGAARGRCDSARARSGGLFPQGAGRRANAVRVLSKEVATRQQRRRTAESGTRVRPRAPRRQARVQRQKAAGRAQEWAGLGRNRLPLFSILGGHGNELELVEVLRDDV